MVNPVPLTLRMASYNIRKALGTDRKRDPLRVMRVIKELGADIVALQEADLRLPPRRPVLDRKELTAKTGLVAVEFNHGRDSLGWHGNAVLVAPDFEVIERSHYDLPGLEPRGLVSVTLAGRGITFRVMATHLGLLRHSRRQQLSAILALLPAEDELPTLIAGDFNERSGQVGLGRLSRRFRILSGGPSYHSRFPLFALDRIAVSESFEPRNPRVLRSREASLASDHLPLMVDLSLQPSSQFSAKA